MPNFIDEDYIIDKKIINNEVKIISFVGHVRKEKGIDEIFEVAKAYPNISFEIIGPIIIKVKDYSIPSNLHLMGTMTKDKVRHRLNLSDIFLFPTHTEGFSMALLEAMALGVPVITTKVGANPDMLENKGGCLVKKKKCRTISFIN